MLLLNDKTPFLGLAISSNMLLHISLTAWKDNLGRKAAGLLLTTLKTDWFFFSLNKKLRARTMYIFFQSIINIEVKKKKKKKNIKKHFGKILFFKFK